MNRNTKPEISVIIPVYNAEKWISRCLESIIKQTFKNFEVIIVNDASQDKSFEIVKQYILKDDRIIIINKEKNEGTMSARESGYIKAKGKYIIFSDADDYFPQNAFQILYDTIITDKSDIVFGGYTIINNNMSQKNIIRYIPTNSSSEEIQNLFLEQKIPYTLWGNIYSTNLFKNQGIYNGLIAVFLLYGIFSNSQLLVTVFVLNVFFAAVYGAVTANKKIIFTQGGPAILTLFSLIISLF